MKKTMFAMAALAAGVCFGDVTSANVVGYDNLALPNASRKSMGFVFKNVGNGNEKLMLTEIKVVGYRDNSYFQEETGAAPNTYLKKMNAFGGTEITYKWYDEYDPFDTFTWLGGWWQVLGGEKIEPGVNDVEIPTAEGFYVEGDSWHGATPVALQCNGEVLVGSYAKALPNGSRKTLVNPMPVGTTLTKLEVQGYRDNTYFQEETGAAPNTYLKKMNAFGGTEITYKWYDEYDPFDTFTWLGGWWQVLGGEKIDPGVNDVEIGPGEGFYVEGDSWHGTTPITLTFPACLEAAK